MSSARAEPHQPPPSDWQYRLGFLYGLSAILAASLCNAEIDANAGIVSAFAAGYFCSLLIGCGGTLATLLLKHGSQLFNGPFWHQIGLGFLYPLTMLLAATLAFFIKKKGAYLASGAEIGLVVGTALHAWSLQPILLHQERLNVRFAQRAVLQGKYGAIEWGRSR